MAIYCRTTIKVAFWGQYRFGRAKEKAIREMWNEASILQISPLSSKKAEGDRSIFDEVPLLVYLHKPFYSLYKSL